MDAMSQILKLLEKTDSIEINEFRMDVDELEITVMPTLQKIRITSYNVCYTKLLR